MIDIDKSNLFYLYLTFDVEDNLNKESMINLKKILTLLDKYKMKGIFFITSEVAEILSCFPNICNILSEHIIGYHSNNHSKKPRIYEYTDIKDYKQAIKKSIIYETNKIDNTTMEIIGRGGVYILKDLFESQKILAFRAPQMCWTPPHIEALRKMGFKYDFSADIYHNPIQHKGITFYPYPYWIDSILSKIIDLRQYGVKRPKLIFDILQRSSCVIGNHPHKLSLKSWDYLYLGSSLKSSQNFNNRQSNLKRFFNIKSLDLFLKLLNNFQKYKKISIVNELKESLININNIDINIDKIYQSSIRVPKMMLNIQPKYLRDHFYKFFT